MGIIGYLTSNYQRLGIFAVSIVALLLIVSHNGYAATQRLGDNNGLNDHPHNFSSLNTFGGISAPVGTEDRICIFCHTPHSSSDKGPLWNRRDPIGPNGDGTFPLYGELSGRLGDIVIDDITADSQYGVGEYPNGASRLCLSCHDGVTAIGEVINPSGGASPLGGLGSILAENPASTAIIDLDTSHPISFVYNATVEAAIEVVKGAGTYQPPSAGFLDNDTRMQCTSCHDPHVDTKDGAYTLPMWRKNTGNDIADYDDTCAECHVGGPTSSGLIINNPATIHPIP